MTASQIGSTGMTSRTHVVIAAGDGIEILTLPDVLRNLGVDDIVRMRMSDFVLLEDLGDTFVHFNFGPNHNVVGKRYAFVPIVTPGRRLENGDEVLPVIDAIRPRFGTCAAVAKGVAPARVTPEEFAHSLPTIRTAAALRLAMLARYSGVYPGLTADEIDRRGCTVSCFTIRQGCQPSERDDA